MQEPILQVALDLLNSERAIKIANLAIKGDSKCWIEAGTPLIKSEGMNIIRSLRRTFPRKTIVADLKVIDTGATEIEMAVKAGADVVCVLAASDDSTISDSIKSARKYGAKTMADLICVEEKLSRSQELEQLGVDYICMHVGIDEQMTGGNPIKTLSEIVKNIKVPLAVAGGLNSESVAEVVKLGASIVIVGSAITKAKNVTRATEEIKKAMMEKKPIFTSFFKKYGQSEIFNAFSKVSTPNISDAMHRKGAMVGINPIKLGFHMVGRALTVSTIDGDWAKPIEAIDKAEKGSVLVVDVKSGKSAIWGELATWSAKMKGLAGVVIDGTVRDMDDIITMDFPIFCKNAAPNAGEPKGLGEIGAEIFCASQTVRTGDWIIGDDSGVVVVPQEIAQEIANRSLNVKETENRIREEIKQGGSLSSVLKLKKWEKKVG